MRGRMMEIPLTLDLLRRHADTLHRDRPVITLTAEEPVRATFGDVLDRASRLAHALHGLGVRPGDVVASLMWNDQQHLEAYVGVPGMGAVLHTLNLRLDPRQIAWIADDGGARVILAGASLAPVVEAVRPHLRVAERIVMVPDEYEGLLAAAPPEPYAWPELDEGEAAMLCYTSGTTGDPRGVLYSHRSLTLHALCLLYADTLGMSARDLCLVVVPMFHANAWGTPHGALAAGCGLLLPSSHVQPGALADALERERATLAAAVPTIWLGLMDALEERPRNLSSLRRVVCGGSAIPEALMRRFDAVAPGALLHAWGMTEISPIGTVASLPAGSESWSGDERLRYRLSQGRQVPGVELRLTGLDGGEAPWDGETLGEIEVRGPWVAASYHGDREAERFVGGWFSTGDIATGSPDRTVRIVDRTKDVIKSGGEWISSVELEGTILLHPAVREAAVVSRPDERWMERPVAFVVLRPGARLTLEELREWLGPRVARFWLPDDLVLADELPKTSVGKLDKKVMRARYAASTEAGAAPAPTPGVAP